MAKIPYNFFHYPKFFFDKGLLKTPNAWAFVTWCFSRCSPEHRQIMHDGKSIDLKPFEFIFGRMACAKETGMTEAEVRAQCQKFMRLSFLQNTTTKCAQNLHTKCTTKTTKQTTNKTTKRFTVLAWSTELFLEGNNQVNNQVNSQVNNQVTTKKQPSVHHKQEEEIRAKKKRTTTPLPPSSSVVVDFSFEKNEEELKHEICCGICLTDAELQECIAARGSRQIVEQIIAQILNWPEREANIKNWVPLIKKWKVKSKLSDVKKEHEDLAKKMQKAYANHDGWRCEIHRDTLKDISGLLFYSSIPSACDTSVFIPFTAKDFKERVSKVLLEKKMQCNKLFMSQSIG